MTITCTILFWVFFAAFLLWAPKNPRGTYQWICYRLACMAVCALAMIAFAVMAVAGKK